MMHMSPLLPVPLARRKREEKFHRYLDLERSLDSITLSNLINVFPSLQLMVVLVCLEKLLYAINYLF